MGKKKENEMKDRDCKSCVHNTPDGCESWDCEYINRAEAIEAYETLKAMREAEAKVKGE